MLEFSKLCKEISSLTVWERSAMLADASVTILAKLHQYALPGVDPVRTLAGFILGAVVADGEVNEQEYLLIYPALVCVFGDAFDFESIKKSFRKDREGRRQVKQYTEEMISFLSHVDESLREDIILLCLCVVSVDNQISFREQRYIRQLCTA